MDAEIRTVDDDIRFLFGANLDLIRWIENNELVKDSVVSRGLLINGLKVDDYIDALGQRNPLDKRERCNNLVKKLWSDFPQFGPYPLQDILIESEDEGTVFHKKYRDHSAHQLMVYLVGLYIYDICPEIKKAINDEIRESSSLKKDKIDENVNNVDIIEEFINRWIISSLLHDCGYIFENYAIEDSAEGEDAERWPLIRGKFNKLFEYPISSTEYFRKEDPTALFSNAIEYTVNNKLKTIQEEKYIPYCLTEDIRSLQKDRKGKDNLEKISMRIASSVFAMAISPKEILSSYYNNITRELYQRGSRREKFFDHGITSALIYLIDWFEYKTKIEAILSHSIELNYNKNDKLLIELQNIKNKFPKEETIWAAVCAMAIHNIDKKTWQKHFRVCHERGFPVESFCIYLSDSPDGRYKGLPLAFLLRLADTLQDWDRPKFITQPERRSDLVDQDLSLQPLDDGNLGLFYRRDHYYHGSSPAWDRLSKEENIPDDENHSGYDVKNTLFATLRKELRDNMDKKAVNRIIKLNNMGDMTHRIELKGEFKEYSLGKFEITPREINKIKYFTKWEQLKPKQLSYCFNSDKNDPKKCSLQWLPLVTLAELNQSGMALERTRLAYEYLNKLSKFIEDVKVYRLFGMESQKITREYIRRTIREFIMGLKRFEEKELGGESVREFLMRRMKDNDKESVNRFFKTMIKLENIINKIVIKESVETMRKKDKMMKLYQDFLKYADNVIGSLNTIWHQLDDILLVRTKETRENIVDQFRTRKPLLEINECYKETNENFPHNKEEYLNVWYGERR